MHAAPLPPHLRTLAPAVAVRVALILTHLAALVARAFLRNPRLVPLIIPLWTRLTRGARRFSKLMAQFAAGHLPRHRPGGRGGRAPKPPIPTANAWLVRTLHHEAAALGSQLAHLLAEPGVAELLAAAPAAARILNPIRRALGLPTATRPRPPRAPPRPAAPPSAVIPPARAGGTLAGSTPSTKPPPVWAPAPPCEHLLARFPFRPFPSRPVILKPA